MCSSLKCYRESAPESSSGARRVGAAAGLPIGSRAPAQPYGTSGTGVAQGLCTRPDGGPATYGDVRASRTPVSPSTGSIQGGSGGERTGPKAASGLCLDVFGEAAPDCQQGRTGGSREGHGSRMVVSRGPNGRAQGRPGQPRRARPASIRSRLVRGPFPDARLRLAHVGEGPSATPFARADPRGLLREAAAVFDAWLRVQPRTHGVAKLPRSLQIRGVPTATG
jgi:hypothetical protein